MSTIKIGKNAIENLTIGMYSDSKIVYREYIQNAADSIDAAVSDGIYNDGEKPQIEIELDSQVRMIRIKDNAYGVQSKDIVHKLANIADSDKERGVDKGFRGIGRLGGLAYCETLRFITTYPGEDIQTTMTWQADELIKKINDPLVKDSAEDVLEKIISYSEEACNPDDHYFIVELQNVREDNKELLDVQHVKDYIAANAPVDFDSKFYLKSEINRYLDESTLTLSKYRIFVDGEDVFKDYNHALYEKSGDTLNQYDEIESLEFKEFRNSSDELLAWMWFGVCAFEKQIPTCNTMRGLRLRRDNIQIGDSRTLIKLFREQRGNYYFVGEIHAVHKDLIPNARRDYFNENHTRLEFENAVSEYFLKLYKLYHNANKAKSAYRKEITVLDKEVKLAKKEKIGFVNLSEKEEMVKEIEFAQKTAEKSKTEIQKLKENAKEDPVFSKVLVSIKKKHEKNLDTAFPEKVNVTPKKEKVSSSIDSEKATENKSEETPLLTDNLVNLNENERKLIGRIYEVIQKVLPPTQSPSLIKKIQDELSKE